MVIRFIVAQKDCSLCHGTGRTDKMWGGGTVHDCLCPLEYLEDWVVETPWIHMLGG